MCEGRLGWHGICVFDAVCGGVTEVAEYPLSCVPVPLAWVVRVSAKEAGDEGEVGADAVGEVPEAAYG